MRALTTTREFGVVLVPGGMASVWPHQTQTQRYSLENAPVMGSCLSQCHPSRAVTPRCPGLALWVQSITSLQVPAE